MKPPHGRRATHSRRRGRISPRRSSSRWAPQSAHPAGDDMRNPPGPGLRHALALALALASGGCHDDAPSGGEEPAEDVPRGPFRLVSSPGYTWPEMAFSPGGEAVAVTSTTGMIRVFSRDDGTERWRLTL